MTERAVKQLSKLLEVERVALLRGDFDVVGSLIAEKEALVTQLETADASDLRLLSTALLHNGRLLAAARDGVSAVVTTLAKQKAARTTLTSYDASGNSREISQPARGTERRY